MNDSLYRREALDNAAPAHLGVVARLPNVQVLAATVSIASAIAIIAFLFLGSYTRRITVTGILEPRNGVINLRSSTPGKVEKVHVSPGARVKAGDPIFTVTTTRETERQGDESSARLDRLLEDRRRLHAELAAIKTSFAEQESALIAELTTSRTMTGRVAAQRTLQARRVEIKRGILQRTAPLVEKGYVSSLQYQEGESDLLKLQSELESLSAQLEKSRQTEINLASRLKILSNELTEKLGLTSNQLSSIEQSIIQTEAERAVLITAPFDGEVSNILMPEGSSTLTSEALATLLPDGDALVARILVDNRAIGFLKVGTPVAIRYRPFPYEKFGLHQGSVSRIPSSALDTQAFMRLPGQTPTNSVYKVDVDLPQQSITVYGRSEHLRAGMEVAADLHLDRRTLAEWIFEPIIGMKKRFDVDGSRHEQPD